MKQFYTIILFLFALLQGASAQKLAGGEKLFLHTSVDKMELQPANLVASKKLSKMRKVGENYDDEFIFDPVGEEKMYIMSQYTYNQKGQQFVPANSLKSQVRYAEDGTVYLKDLYTSLGVITWVKGTLDGDTIRVPFGQPLAYYKGNNLIFFAPMEYDDSTGNMEALDELKLIVRNDSLIAPTFEPEGHFQAVAGYVYISEETQGFISLDLDHRMAALQTPMIQAPQDVEPVEYIMSYENSSGRASKAKVNIKQKDNDIYMQLSTSAPESYIHGTLEGDKITIANYQAVTDSTFIYFYSLADPIYTDGEITDFMPSGESGELIWNPETKEITSPKDQFGVDYMDGLEYCMNFTLNQQLEIYKGEHPLKPETPSWVALNIGGFMANISFILPNTAVNGEYINTDNVTYQVLLDEEPMEFNNDDYKFIKEPTTELDYNFSDNFDFWIYGGGQHYVYLYADLFTTIGVRSIYTVNGARCYSDILMYNTETGEQYVISDLMPGDANNDRELTMADANKVVNYYTTGYSEGINFEAADMNADSEVTMADANAVVNIFVNATE